MVIRPPQYCFWGWGGDKIDVKIDKMHGMDKTGGGIWSKIF